MRIRASVYGLTFSPEPSIRKSIFDLEESLRGYQKPFNLIPVPDDAPFEFPRITANSTNGHSTLILSAMNAQIQVAYDGEYSENYSKCLAYSKEKALELFDSLKKIVKTQIQFSGITVQVDFPEIAEADLAEYISSRYMKISSELDLDDAAVKLVYKINSRYYLNLEIKKDLLFVGGLQQGALPDATDLENAQPILSLALDVNDRYAFNHDRSHECSSEDIAAIYDIAEDYLTNRIHNLIGEGVVLL